MRPLVLFDVKWILILWDRERMGQGTPMPHVPTGVWTRKAYPPVTALAGDAPRQPPLGKGAIALAPVQAQNTPRACALGVSQSLPRARGKRVLALPVAEKARALFPQRSKNTRKSVSPKCFSGTARWIGGPLCVPCGYAVDEVPGARIMDSIVLGQLGQGAVPCPMLQRRRGTVKCDPSFY